MHTVGINGSVMQWAALVKLHLPAAGAKATTTEAVASSPKWVSEETSSATPQPPHRHWNAVRLVLASVQICYYAIHGEGVDDQEWTAIIERGLLGRDEARTLQTYPGNQPWLALCWGVAEIRAQVDEAEGSGGMFEKLTVAASSVTTKQLRWLVLTRLKLCASERRRQQAAGRS